MANSIITNSILTKEALIVAKSKIGELKKRMNVGYATNFAKEGHKIGDTLNVRLPGQFSVGSGEAMTPQDHEQKSVAITVNKQRHIGLAFGDQERTMKVDNFNELILEPAVTTLVEVAMAEVMLDSYKQIGNYAGIPHAMNLPNGTAPFGAARAKLLSLGAPLNNLTAAIDPFVEDSMAQGQQLLFNPSATLKDQYLDNSITRAAGLDFVMSQVVPKHLSGSYGGASITSGATADGATSIGITGGSASTAGFLKAGDIVQWAGVFAVHPQTKQSTGKLRDFVVTADVATAGSGVASVGISPAMIASGPYQNVSNVPASGAAMTVYGQSGSTGAGLLVPQSLVFHKSAIALCVVPLEKGKNMTVETDEETGLSIRFWEDTDITSGKAIKRLDILFGSKVVRPEFAARVVGRLS